MSTLVDHLVSEADAETGDSLNVVDAWAPVHPVTGQETLFEATLDMYAAPAPPLPVPHPRPRRRTTARSTRGSVMFRRTGTTLTATVNCEDAEHRVQVHPDGTVIYSDHDQAGLALLRALGSDEVLPCQRVGMVAEAAQDWLNRRLRLTAPQGHWNTTTKRWSSREEEFCCRTHSAPITSSKRAPSRVAWGQTVEPGGLLAHSRSVKHVAIRHGVNVADTEKVAQWLCAQKGIATNPRDMPESSIAQFRALLPEEITEVHLANLWVLGVTVPFLTAVAGVHPAEADPEVGRFFSADTRAYRYYSRVTDWWMDDLDPEWITAVGTHANRHWPTGEDSCTSWVYSLQKWRGLDADVLGSYFAAGVRQGLPTLVSKEVPPAVAAEFQALTAAAGRQGTGLAEWIDARYEVATAFAVAKVDVSAYPMRYQADIIAIDNRLRSDAGQTSLSAEERQRLLAVAALVRTPARSVKWWQTRLPLATIAESLAAGVSPAVAVRRTQRL